MSNIYRDKYINELTEQDVGTELRVCGWVENIRDHGGVSCATRAFLTAS